MADDVEGFTDVLADESDEDTGGDTSEETVTATDSSTREFADTGVRSTLPAPDETRSTKRYEDPNADNAADDVDARGLFRTPSINELRYYAREGPYGKSIVHKPIHDAFKHGYEIVDDPSAGEDDEGGKLAEFFDLYEDYYKRAEKKSSRDGMAVLMHVIDDAAETASEPIDVESASFAEDFQLWTVDNLSDDISEAEAAKHVEYDAEQLYLSEGDENGGVVVVDDIGHPNHGDIVGYGVEPRKKTESRRTATFVHAERCQHFVWGEHVDGPLNNDLNGQHIGESVLTPVLRPLISTQMGFWALQNILLRYSAPLHAVEPPESWGMDDFEEAREKLDDLSMASDGVLPPGAELTVAEGVSEFDPEPVFDVLVEAICAGTVFTKSVLQGVQTGTVSGSETDVKGYFNEIHLLRQQRVEPKWREAAQMVSQYDQEYLPRNTAFADWSIDWGPLFKPTSVEQAEAAVSLVTGMSTAINRYILTPSEARSILEQEWATFDIDVDLGELTEEDKDELDRAAIREIGRGPMDDEPTDGQRENPRLQNGGGQPEGQNRDRSQPMRDSVSEDLVDAIADEVCNRLDDDS